MGKHTFDFDAGELCLNFANTVNWHASANPVENLINYEDFVAWGEQANLLSAEAANSLLQKATRKTEKSADFLKHAIRLREAIYTIFSRWYAGKSIPEDALSILNPAVQQAMSHLQLVPGEDKVSWDWAPNEESQNFILWSVARSAAELLTSEKANLVRECEDDRGCGYLFIDMSKNHSRRWCSMESCGNRAKARRHYTKVKAGSLKNPQG